MVGVAQRLEYWSVEPDVGGSSPLTHPDPFKASFSLVLCAFMQSLLLPPYAFVGTQGKAMLNAVASHG